MGGSGGGQQNSVAEFKPPGYTEQAWKDYLASGQALANVPYSQSGIPQVSPINAVQMSGNQFAIDRSLNGAPDLNAGRSAAMNAANGAYSNVMGLQNVGGIAAGQAANPWSEGLYGMANMGDNPYMSDQYSQEIINNNADQMAKAYSVGGAAQNDAAAAMQGAYGGSAYNEMVDRGKAGLAQQIGQMASNVQQQQQQYKGSMRNADQQMRMQAMGMGGANYNSDVNNQLAANQQFGNIWQNNIGNMLSGGALAGQLSQDDWQAANALGAAGNNYNSYVQKLLDQYNNQWGVQNGYDANMNEMLGNILSRASGGQGSQISSVPGQSPWAGIAGLLGAGAGAYQMFKP